MKKKVLIIGGSSDIGIQLVKKFLLKGSYKIFLHYNSNTRAVNLFKRKCKLIKEDLSNLDYKDIQNKFSNDYDIIINLIGYVNGKSFEKFSLESLEKTLRTNSFIPQFIIRNSLKNMIKKKWGRVVNSSSVGVKFGGGKQNFEYSLSKHINEFIPIHIRKLAEKNIFYNVLKIGLTDTKLHKKIPNKRLKERTKLVPTKRMATPNTIADYIYYLSTEKNQFIANEVINITGGE